MPPKAKYTKEQIVDTAFSLVREQGKSALSARTLARALGTSSAPIFTAFPNMEAVQNEVVKSAKALYRQYVEVGLQYDPPFKGAGLQYIQFALDEPNLFELLFMWENDGVMSHFVPSNDDNAPAILQSVQDTYALPTETAKRLYNHMAVYTHGIAVLFAKTRVIFTMEEVSNMMTEALYRRIFCSSPTGKCIYWIFLSHVSMFTG